MGGMTTSAVEVLVGVRWFGMKISNQIVPVACYFCIKEHDGLPRPLTGKFDGHMIHINVVYKFGQFFLVVCPDGKYVVYVPPPNDRFCVLPSVKVSSLTCP